MSERSEFGLRAPLTEKRRGPPRLYRGGSRPAKGLFGSFLFLQKGTRTRSGRKPCTCSAFASFTAIAWVQILREEQSFRAVRAAYFCLGKSKQNRHRRTLADAMKPHRFPALLA